MRRWDSKEKEKKLFTTGWKIKCRVTGKCVGKDDSLAGKKDIEKCDWAFYINYFFIFFIKQIYKTWLIFQKRDNVAVLVGTTEVSWGAYMAAAAY